MKHEINISTGNGPAIAVLDTEALRSIGITKYGPAELKTTVGKLNAREKANNADSTRTWKAIKVDLLVLTDSADTTGIDFTALETMVAGDNAGQDSPDTATG